MSFKYLSILRLYSFTIICNIGLKQIRWIDDGLKRNNSNVPEKKLKRKKSNKNKRSQLSNSFSVDRMLLTGKEQELEELQRKVALKKLNMILMQEMQEVCKQVEVYEDKLVSNYQSVR